MTIHLLTHHVKRLWKIIDSIPKFQRRTIMKKWHTVLGKLRYIVIALPAARHMFGCLQNVITPKIKTRVDLNKGFHQALDNFRWIAQDLKSCPTLIDEIIPLFPRRKVIMMPQEKALEDFGSQETLSSLGRGGTLIFPSCSALSGQSKSLAFLSHPTISLDPSPTWTLSSPAGSFISKPSLRPLTPVNTPLSAKATI